MEYELVRDRLRSFDGAEHGAGATQEEIAAAEGALGVVFPEAYRRFVADFGWAAIGGSEIFGLGRDVPPYLDVAVVAVAERDQFLPGIPAEALPVMNDGGGNLFCVDCSDRDARMTFWDHETGESDLGVGFVGWLNEAISEA